MLLLLAISSFAATQAERKAELKRVQQRQADARIASRHKKREADDQAATQARQRQQQRAEACAAFFALAATKRCRLASYSA